MKNLDLHLKDNLIRQTSFLRKLQVKRSVLEVCEQKELSENYQSLIVENSKSITMVLGLFKFSHGKLI